MSCFTEGKYIVAYPKKMIVDPEIMPVVVGVFAGAVLASLSTLIRVRSLHFYRCLREAVSL